MRIRTIGKALVLAISVSGVTALSVAQTAQKPQFEVASIKRNESVQRGMSLSTVGNRFRTTNAPVKMLILNAYPVHSFQVVGGPDWINTQGFDIDAVFSVAPTVENVRVMLQALLKDRFNLELHQDMRDMPMYRLILAKDGPKLLAAKEDERTGVSGSGLGRMRFQSVSVSTLADNLSWTLDRVVTDETGLKGKYTFKLEWTPDNITDPNATAPSLFTALQEQLGLKLESSKAPLDVLVIDSVQRPTEN